MYDLRLVVYTPNGGKLGLLPTPLKYETAHPLNDLPALRLTYSAAATNAALLDSPCEVAVEWSADGEVWAEPPDGRFLRIGRATDVADQSGVASYECPGYAWQLRKLVLFPPDDLSLLVEGKRLFSGKNAGEILTTFLTEGQGRGTVPGLVYDFTTALDSAGAAWDTDLTISYEPGINTLAALVNLAEQGVVDWRMVGRTLQVFNAGGSLARDFASGAAPVDLRLGRDIEAAPDRGTLEDAASAVLVVGDDGFRLGLSRPDVVPWGRWETYLVQGGVSDVGTAVILADAALDRVEAERVQRTRQIVTRGARWLPWQDYRPGDYLLAPGQAGQMTSLRVRQITLTRDRSGVVAGNLVLGDRFLERDVRLARKAAGIVGGFTSTAGTGAPVSDDRARTPAAPTGLAVSPVAYIDPSDGVARGQITASWNPVTLDTDGEAVTVSGYELFLRINVSGELWYLAATTQAGDTTATFSPLQVNVGYAFKVRAVASGASGVFSSQVAVTIPTDATPPAVPSTPVLSTRLGVIHAKWNGLDSTGQPMAADFDRVRVWIQDPLSPGASEAGYLQAAGSVVIPGQPYGATREVWFTAVDRSGNSSAASTSATIATQAVVDTDLIGEVIDGAHLIDGSITASEKIIASTITGALIQALAISTGHLAANSVTTAKLAAGSVDASIIAANAVTAAKLEAVLTVSTRVVAGSPTGARVELNSTGLVAYNGSGVQTASIVASSGAVSIIGQLATGTTGDRIVINPTGASSPEIRFYATSGSNYARIYCSNALIGLDSANASGTSQTQFKVSDTEFRAHIWNPSSGLAGGGYIFGQPSQLEVGYNDASANLSRFRFTSAYTEHVGKWSYQSGGAGLIMAVWTVTIGTRSTVSWAFTMASTPRVAVGVSFNSTTGGNIWAVQSNITTSSYGIGVHATTDTGSAILALWAWRM